MRADAEPLPFDGSRLVREDQRSNALRSGLGLLPARYAKTLSINSRAKPDLKPAIFFGGHERSASFTTPTLPF